MEISLERAAYIASLQGAGVARSAAERMATEKFGPAVVVDARTEKDIEHLGDVMMQKLGFEVIRFSHPGKTKQTPGIADRLYIRRPRSPHAGIAVWVEYKSATGRQRPGQAMFQELVTSVGQHYVLGGLDELSAWLKGVL